LEDGALAGAANAYRRLAAWAQAGELATVAQMASRSAAAGKHQSVDEDGRPSAVPADAYGQVSLALTMSQAGAEWWTNLAVDLQWRLAATGLALREGTIDLARAKAIAEATGPLDDAKARAVEDKVLPRAGEQTTGQLRASLRRAVIKADPEGAERRREQAERQAKVVLYPDAEGTASLSGQKLPGIRAAAAFARITALARALKATGVDGGIDLLRSKVLLGLLLGTLPYIPPPPNAPRDPDVPPGLNHPPDSNATPDPTATPGPDHPPYPDGPTDLDHLSEPHSTPDPNATPDLDHRPCPDGPTDTDPADGRPADDACNPHTDDWPWINDPAPGMHKPTPAHDSSDRDDPPRQGTLSNSDGGSLHDWPTSEDFADEGQSPADEDWHRDDDQSGDHRPFYDFDDPVRENSRADPVPWPEATTFLPPGPAALKNLQPAGSGYLDLRIPWITLTQGGAGPGYLTRLGPITPAQASYLALLATADPAVQWRIVLTDHSGRATAVTRIKIRPASAGPARASPSGPSSLLHRVTVIMPADELSSVVNSGLPANSDLAIVAAAIMTAARKAADQAAERAAADAAAGGCAHTQASQAYQVPARLREFINLRDLTCRFPTCRQPAARCDADHTKPHDQGGPTCLCNLGPVCRYHHQLKQQPGWRLEQPAPGSFTWTTPTGRSYNVQPDQQAA
jgi:hypothetical protein